MPEKLVRNFSCAQMQENKAHRETGTAPCRESYPVGQQVASILKNGLGSLWRVFCGTVQRCVECVCGTESGVSMRRRRTHNEKGEEI